MSDYSKKLLAGTIEKAKLPQNIMNYDCQFVIDEYKEGNDAKVTEKYYFKFTLKDDPKQIFIIDIHSFGKPKNLMHAFTIKSKNQSNQLDSDSVFQLKQKFVYFLSTSVNSNHQKPVIIQKLDQSEDEVYPDCQVEVRYLDLGQQNQYDDESSDRGFEPSQYDNKHIKTQLIMFLHHDENRHKKLKDIRQYLKQKNFTISEQRVKSILTDICKPLTDKKVGYILKQQYFDRQQHERRNMGAPRKRLKEQ